MKKHYEPTSIKDLGTIQDLTQGNRFGHRQDNIYVNSIGGFGTVSGVPAP